MAAEVDDVGPPAHEEAGEVVQADGPVGGQLQAVAVLRPGDLGPTSAVWGRKPLENQGPVDFSVTIRLVSPPGFYWTYDLYRHPKRLVHNPVVRLGCCA